MNWSAWFEGFAGASPQEWVATVSGFICVYLVIKRNIWCFAFGFVQVSIYAWIFYDVKLYSDMALHVFYIGFQIYGWMLWKNARNIFPMSPQCLAEQRLWVTSGSHRWKVD
jgi:nicotinamide mononucleotide transporter